MKDAEIFNLKTARQQDHAILVAVSRQGLVLGQSINNSKPAFSCQILRQSPGGIHRMALMQNQGSPFGIWILRCADDQLIKRDFFFYLTFDSPAKEV